MKFAIIASKKDKAGMNIVSFLKNSNLPIYYTEKEIIYAENIDKEQNIDADFIIFASKHASEQQRKTLSVHAPGNWNKAEMGGKKNEVCKTSALFLKHLFEILNQEAEKANSDYQVTLEVTHHGPYIEKPCCFIEIGSSENEWQDKKAGKIIAETIKKATETEIKKYKTAIGIGGPHYCPNFNKIQLSSEYALGHIVPQYVFPITEKQIKESINKTKEKVSLAIIDWKGLKGRERQETIKLLEKINLKHKKTSEVEK